MLVLTTLAVLSLVILSMLSSPSIHSSASSMTSGPWPMFHQNAQHTGLSSFPGPTVPFLKWKLQTSGPVDSSPAIGFGRVYVGSEDGSLYALNLQGNLLWKFQTSSPIRTSSAIGSDGTIYLASYIKSASGEHEGILYAINPGGNLKWNFTLANFQGDDSLSSPIIGPDGTIYASDEGGGVVAVHPDGTLKWEVAASGEVFGPPALGPDGTVYVGVDDPDPSGACGQCLLAINPDGTVKWGVLHIGTFFSPAVGSDGTVYIQGFAINPNGTVKWENGAFSSPSIGFDGTIYGTMDDLDATNPDGTLRWVFPVRGSASCTPAGCSYVYVQPSSVAIGSNGILYFGVGITHFCNCAPVPSGSQNASLYAVSSNETLVWKFPIGTTNACTSECPFFALSDPAIGSNGTVYVGSTDGNLYAVG